MSTIPFIVNTVKHHKRPRVETRYEVAYRETLIDDLTDAYFTALVDHLYYERDDLTQESLDDFFDKFETGAPLQIYYFIDGEWFEFDEPSIDVLSAKYKQWQEWLKEEFKI